MASIRLEKVTKIFRSTKALNNMTLDIKDGEFFCVLGPPGAGKTTLLRLIVGLEKPDEGKIYIGGESMEGVHPSRRDIAMIFQNLALYPDKTVFDNIAFPLRQQRMPEDELNSKVKEVAKNLKIDWQLNKIPSQLSGGERQRVAIGRAIVRQPKAYLMDEPLSNLDALLRLEMRVTLKELQTSLKETFVYVTHDQVEALSMGDRIAILNNGLLQQVDEPEKIYKLPANMFVAAILGSPPMNFLECEFKKDKGKVSLFHKGFTVLIPDSEINKIIEDKIGIEGLIVLGIRPEDIIIHKKAEKGLVSSEVYVIEPLGNETIVDIKVGDKVIKVLASPDFEAKPGERVWLEIKKGKLHFFNKKTGQALYHADGESEIEIK